MASVLEKVLRVGEGRTIKRLEAYARAVNALEEDFQSLTDEELRNETNELRERYGNGESLDDLLPEAFAAVREASVRTLGMRHFDVQIMGGAAQHHGKLAQIEAYGAQLERISGHYGNSFARAMEVSTTKGYANLTTTYLNPFGVDALRLVEGGDGERHAIRCLVGQRRAAIGAEAASRGV